MDSTDQKFVCDGCGEPKPYSPSIAIFNGVVTTDGERRQLSPSRYCDTCVTFFD